MALLNKVAGDGLRGHSLCERVEICWRIPTFFGATLGHMLRGALASLFRSTAASP